MPAIRVAQVLSRADFTEGSIFIATVTEELAKHGMDVDCKVRFPKTPPSTCGSSLWLSIIIVVELQHCS